MTRVKICGITNLEDAISACELGADELGFNFYAESPRFITPQMAREIIGNLPPTVQKVGVFVNETQENVLRIAEAAGLDALQLHGDEDIDLVHLIRSSTAKSVIKAVRSKPDIVPGEIEQYDVDAILIDSYSAEEYGGTGKQFDWEIARKISTRVDRIYLAGGLSYDNVGDAIRKVSPYAVDASSRLESAPGKKDREKVAAFIRAAKEAL